MSSYDIDTETGRRGRLLWGAACAILFIAGAILGALMMKGAL